MADGVLFVYHRPTRRQFVDAANVDENIAAFPRHSKFQVWGLNTDIGTPPRLPRLEFDAVVIHYSVFLPLERGYLLGDDLLGWLDRSSAYKIATFQDEHHYCGRRFAFLNDHGIDCVYTMLEPPHAEQVYRENTKASRIVSNFPAYVGPELLETADRFAKPDAERTLDIGYRGRPMPAYMGAGAQEKSEIGDRFAELAAASGLSLDIGTGEEDRLYGDDWNRFVGNSKGTLGVESGVSCFDLHDEVRAQWEALAADGHEPTVAEMQDGALGEWDWKIPYRTISPRNFEAAAMRMCQILYEGHYSGVMEPMVHYIPLKKDFSNLGEALERFRDDDVRRGLTENAHRDLIASNAYGYQRLVEGFDDVLSEAGLVPKRSASELAAVGRRLKPALRDRVTGWIDYRSAKLKLEHPRVWNWIWIASRPVFVPLRALQRLVRG